MRRLAIANPIPTRRWQRRLFVTLGMLLALPVVPTPAASSAASGVPRPVNGVYFGSWVKPLGGESKLQALMAREQQIGRSFAIDHQYYAWNASIPTTHERWTAEQGRIPFVTWNARRSDGTVASWNRIASGAEDAWIAARADAFKGFASPVYLSFHHEPENDVPAVGQPSEFAAAFRRIVDVFRGRGVTNVTFVWTMMAWSFEKQAAEALKFYPGDAWVDVVAADGYNWYPGRTGSKWRSFEEIMSNTRNFAVAHGKTFMAAEYGVQEDPQSATRKGNWFRDVLTTAKKWPELVALVYFDSDKIYRWMPDTSASALSGYRDLAADPYMSATIADGPTSEGTTDPAPVPTEAPVPSPTPDPDPSPTPTPTPTPSATREWAASFDAGSDGRDVTTANADEVDGHALDDVRVTSGSTMVYDDTHALGSMAVRHRLAEGGDAAYAWDTPMDPGASWSGRVYVWFDTYPSGIARIVRGRQSQNLAFAIDLQSTGKVRIVDSANNQVLVSPITIARSAWVRIEWTVDHAVGTIELRVFDDPSSSTPSAVAVSSPGRPIRSSVDRVQFGRSGHQNNAVTFWTDEPAVTLSS